MSESLQPPRGIRQPAPRLPELTGNSVTDKANKWFFSAQWFANQAAREEDTRIAQELDLCRPEASHMPDFRENHSEILTRLAETIENPGTQQMLATFEDIRQSTLKHGIDIMSLQMQMLEAVFANPHM